MRSLMFAAFAASSLLVACGHATVWSQDQGGGVLVLNGEESAAMDDAKKIMASHCGPGRFEILRRDTVVVGEQAVTNHSQSAPNRHGSSSSTVTSVHDVTETRITYACTR